MRGRLAIMGGQKSEHQNVTSGCEGATPELSQRPAETKPWRVHVAARTGTVEDSDTESDAEWDSESEDEWETGDEMEVWGEGPPREVEPERDK